MKTVLLDQTKIYEVMMDGPSLAHGIYEYIHVSPEAV